MAQLTLNQTTLLGATTGTIACQLLPIQGRQLLLPSASVVEVIEGAAVEQVANHPSWYVGQLTWRDSRIPVLSFEGLNGQPMPREHGRVVVLNGISRATELPHYAIVVQGEPRQARVKIAQLEDLEAAPVGPVEFLQVRCAGELACIPDLDALEGVVAGQSPQ